MIIDIIVGSTIALLSVSVGAYIYHKSIHPNDQFPQYPADPESADVPDMWDEMLNYRDNDGSPTQAQIAHEIATMNREGIPDTQNDTILLDESGDG